MPTSQSPSLRARLTRLVLAAMLATVSALTIAPATAQAHSHCQLDIDYALMNVWSDGYLPEVTVTNQSHTPPRVIEDWVIALVFTDPVEINMDLYWGIDYIGSNRDKTQLFFQSPAWNSYLYPDQYHTFGYVALGAAQEPVDAYMVAANPCEVTLT